MNAPAPGLPPPDGAPEDAGDPGALIDALAERIVRRGLSAPAILFLETGKPLSTWGSHALVFLEPFLRDFFRAGAYERGVRLLEDRSNLERLIRRIEEREEDARRERDEGKARRRTKKDRESGAGADREPGNDAGSEGEKDAGKGTPEERHHD